MAYDKKKLEAKAVDVIKKEKLLFVSHVIPYLECAESTFYDKDLEKSELIKGAIAENRVHAKKKMLNKWVDSDNPTLQIAGYKLISSDEEHEKLTGQRVDHTSKGESIKDINININRNKDES